MSRLTFGEYQKKAQQTALYLDAIMKRYPRLPKSVLRSIALMYIGNGLGEVGEVQGKIKKIIRDDAGELSSEKVAQIADEIGDVLWYCASLCTELGISIEEVANNNLVKLRSRKSRGAIIGSGDNR